MNTLPNNLFIGKVLITLDETDSSNTYAKELLSKNKPPEGAVIFAHHQTSGKGQFGKTWESESGRNLTFSIILYPVFLDAQTAFSLVQAVCVGLKDYTESIGISVRIKWPNDIYHHDKKLAGLLIENGLTGERLSYSIAGIGLNVNQTVFSAHLPNPTSLKLISEKEFEPMSVLNEIFSFVENRYLQLKSGRLKEIRNEFTNSLYGLNEKREYKAPNENFEGIIRGVNYDGRLMLEVNGAMKLFSNNEIVSSF